MPVWIIVVLLGIIEGITEFLPISSTGHLLITEKLLQIGGVLSPSHWLVAAGAQKDLFNIVIQSGAVLAVLPLFPDRLRQFAFQWREEATQAYLLKIFVAFFITGVFGLGLDKAGFKLPEELAPVALALFLGGIGFVVVETWLRGREPRNEITWGIVLAVGIGQLIAAVFPGTSRSGTTILLALVLGLNRVAATEFTFLVGIPTMLAAGGWKILKALRHPAPGTPQQEWAMVALGFIIAAVVSFLAVKWLLRYIQTHTFVAFGWYRIGAAILLVAVWLIHGAR
jgi:undecaprenyl-diphosphatase